MRLGLPDEVVLNLGGLDVTHPATDGQQEAGESDAAHLFVAMATRADPTYAPTDVDRTHIQALCEAVSGLPLGIELAAAWVRLLSIHAIVQELAKGLDLLTDGRNNADNRHQSLARAFDYSWQLLNPEENNLEYDCVFVILINLLQPIDLANSQ